MIGALPMSRMHLGLALAVLLGAFALVATAKDSDAGAAEIQQVEAFSSVSFALPGEMTLVQTAEPMVSIDATPKQLEDIVVAVENGRLLIKKRRNSGWGPDLDDVQVQVGYQQLDAVQVAGSGTALADAIASQDFSLGVAGSGDIMIQALDGDRVDIDLSGSGDVQIGRLAVNNVSTSISGSGDIVLAGEAGKQRLRIAGSGDYEATELRSAIADLSIAGSGTAHLQVSERISGSVAGSGDLYYRGEPEVAVRVAGSGSISRLDQPL